MSCPLLKITKNANLSCIDELINCWIHNCISDVVDMSKNQIDQINKRFPKETLELSFKHLREPYPALALLLQNQLVRATQKHKTNPENDLPLALTTQEASEIIVTLSMIAEKRADNDHSSKEQLIELRSLLLDWLIYAQSHINSETPKKNPD